MFTRKSHQKIFWISILISVIIFFLILILKEKREVKLETTNSDKNTFLPTVVNDYESSNSENNMVWIPGGTFSMGCNTSDESLCSIGGVTKDAQPIHQVYLDGFWMDKTEVTNAQFAEFVSQTGYITIAEQKPSQNEFPNVLPADLVAGSIVFSPTPNKVDLRNYMQWWSFVEGANWRHPSGPDDNIIGKDDYPVVQVCYEDALAYAKWANKKLPTEAQWEFAARGGHTGLTYVWGNDLKIGNKYQANIYQGNFPVNGGDTGEDGFVGLAKVAQYQPNSYKLYDMAGNVWEWCNDWYDENYYLQIASGIVKNPMGPKQSSEIAEPKRVHRGGSFLCTSLYCTRFMVGTRGKGDSRTASNHLGFRCVK
jgi:formylglycine-generating enzyme required for sulfatase activity